MYEKIKSKNNYTPEQIMYNVVYLKKLNICPSLYYIAFVAYIADVK